MQKLKIRKLKLDGNGHLRFYREDSNYIAFNSEIALGIENVSGLLLLFFRYSLGVKFPYIQQGETLSYDIFNWEVPLPVAMWSLSFSNSS